MLPTCDPDAKPRGSLKTYCSGISVPESPTMSEVFEAAQPAEVGTQWGQRTLSPRSTVLGGGCGPPRLLSTRGAEPWPGTIRAGVRPATLLAATGCPRSQEDGRCPHQLRRRHCSRRQEQQRVRPPGATGRGQAAAGRGRRPGSKLAGGLPALLPRGGCSFRGGLWPLPNLRTAVPVPQPSDGLCRGQGS